MTNDNIAIGYVRRSKKTKAKDKTISLEEQTQQISAYCKQRNFDLREVISHDGISGTKRVRFNAIKLAIENHKATCLVVYHLDRLSRDVGGLLDFVRSMALKGIQVYEVGSGQVDLSKSTGFILTAVKGAFDELFPLIIGEKTSDALQRKKRNGIRYTNIPPFGYQYSDGQIVKDESEQDVLVSIMQYQKAGLGARRIRRKLIESGYKGRMSLGLLHNLIHTPFRPLGGSRTDDLGLA